MTGSIQDAVVDRTRVVAGLVSAIVPVFNRAGLLREAVASVLGQTHAVVEVIIVDDGSTDDTPQMAAALADLAPGRVRVFRQDNAGPGAARNLGLGKASGEFIQYLDSDDLLEPRKFEWQVEALRQHPEAGVAYGLTRRVNVSTGEARDWARTGEAITDIFPGFLMKRGWDTNSPLWRRSVCDAVGPWLSLRCMEDWEHDLRAGLLGVVPVQVPHHVATVRDHGGARASGMQTGFTPDLTRDFFIAHRALWKRMREAGRAEGTHMAALSRKLFWIARMCGERGLSSEADEALQMARQMLGSKRPTFDLVAISMMRTLLGWPLSIRLSERARKLMARKGAGSHV